MSDAALAQQLEEIAASMVCKDYVTAFANLQKVPLQSRTPLVLSALALCMAEVKGAGKSVVNLCHEAIKKDPKNPEHYYRQGRILFLAGRKKDAIWVLRMGLRYGKHRGIIEALGAMGVRRSPPLGFLPRSNPLNKYLGILLTKINLR